MKPLKSLAIASTAAALALTGCAPQPTPERNALIASFGQNMRDQCAPTRTTFTPDEASDKLGKKLLWVATDDLRWHATNKTTICFDARLSEGKWYQGQYDGMYYPGVRILSLHQKSDDIPLILHEIAYQGSRHPLTGTALPIDVYRTTCGKNCTTMRVDFAIRPAAAEKILTAKPYLRLAPLK